MQTELGLLAVLSVLCQRFQICKWVRNNVSGRVDVRIDHFSTERIGFRIIHCVYSQQGLVAVIPDRLSIGINTGSKHGPVKTGVEPGNL